MPQLPWRGAQHGGHACGAGEADDLLALVQALRAGIRQGLALALVGFSFGAHVVSRIAAALSEAGAPASSVVLASLPDGRVPAGRSYDSPGHFGGDLVLGWARRHDKAVTVLPEADHFFTGQLPLLRRLVVTHVTGATAA